MPSTTFLTPIGRKPRHQPLHLNVESLVAVRIEECRVRGQEGIAVDGASQGHFHVERRIEREGDAPEGALGAMVIGTVAEGTDTHALLAQTIEVDIGRDHLGPVREALGFRQELAILEHRDMAVPSEIGGRFSQPRSGI